MWSQARARGNRKGVSIMVGYVLLVVFAVILGSLTYNWIKTYVPGESLQCPSGVSIFIKSTSYDCDDNQFNITVKNNGRFSILGYFVHVTNESAQELATIDLSQYLNETFEGEKFGNSVAFISTEDNPFDPGDEKKVVFDLPLEIGKIESIQIIPTRTQEQDNRKRFTSCGDSRIRQQIICGVSGDIVGEEPACVPDCTGRVCGLDPNCGETCLPNNCELSDEHCDASGQCISNSCIPAADPTLLGICGTRECGILTDNNGTCGDVNCGLCIINGESCNEITGQCESSCNGNWEGTSEAPGIECDGTPLPANCLVDCTCEIGYAPDGSGGCVLDIPAGPAGCSAYCNLFEGYSDGTCTQNPNKCDDTNPLGVYIGSIEGANETLATELCTLFGGNTPACCCFP